MSEVDRKVMVGYDSTPRGEDALALGGLLAESLDAALIVACVYPQSEAVSARIGPPAAEEELRAQAERVVGEVDVRRGNVVVRRIAVGSPSPARGLHELAEHEQPLAVILGSTHRGAVGRLHPGSVAERLLTGAPCAVGVAPSGYADRHPSALGTIAVAFNGSPEAASALRAAVELAERAGGKLRLLTVLEMAPGPVIASGGRGYAEYVATEHAELRRRLEAAVRDVPPGLHATGACLEGETAAALVEETAAHTDLLVMGSRGYGRLHQVLVGADSNRVMKEARCPVLVFPRGSDAPLTPASGPAATVAERA
jgi:nucleotide-binding universal stress UspA family protein